ncbi:MAG: hypothetical protein EP349_06000 [Alphaproteobacteria bacterium]|nr:MAG: hypothetical protein EP349_06000 [Alphaproteobacteria bacterium]
MSILGKIFRLCGVGMPVVVMVGGMILAASMHLSVKEAGAQSLMSCTFRVDGSRQNMFRTGKTDGKVSLRNGLGEGDVYGYGQVNLLQGDIILYGGKSYIAVPGADKPSVEERDDLKAVFLAYGRSHIWQEIPIERELFGLGEVEDFIAETARSLNMPMDEMFVFRIEGKIEHAKYGVIYRAPTNTARHTPGEHSSATSHYNVEGENLFIVGAWAGEDNSGQYTARTETMQMYMINEAKDKAGHIENITIQPGAILYWPNC